MTPTIREILHDSVGRGPAAGPAALRQSPGNTNVLRIERAGWPRAVLWYVWCCSQRVVRLSVALALPAGRTEQVVHALRLLASSVRIEPGCLGCRVWLDELESRVRYEEEWTTEAAMRARVQSQRFTRLLEVLELAEVPPWVEFDFVSQTRGLEYVAEVRDIEWTSGNPPRDTPQ